MRNKITLSEQILITSILPDHLPLDLNYMKNNKKETPAELIKKYSGDNYSAPSTPIPFTNN